MSKIITYSRFYPAYHPKKGEETFFIPKILASLDIPFITKINYLKELYAQHSDNDLVFLLSKFLPKHHTLRTGNRWKAGDLFSPRIWLQAGGHYVKGNKLITIAPDIEIKKVWDVEMDLNGVFSINGKYIEPEQKALLAKNDGLSEEDFFNWFMPDYNKPKEFHGQIICHNADIDY